MRTDAPLLRGGRALFRGLSEGRRRRMLMAGAGSLAVLLGGAACKEEAKQQPVVVAPVKANSSDSIRICPKCYRRFFGGQERCTVDGTELMNYSATVAAEAANAPTAAPQATAAPVVEADPQAEQPPAVAQRPESDAVRNPVANRPSSVLGGGDTVEPVRVRTAGGDIPPYVPPPTREADPPPEVASRPVERQEQPAPREAEPLIAEPAPRIEAPAPTSPPPPVVEAPAEVSAPPAEPPAAVAAKPSRPVEEILATLFADRDATVALAEKGKLSPDEVGALTTVPVGNEEQFTASRTFLAMHYKARGNNPEYGKSLEALMQIPTNQYNPTIRLEQAEYYLLTGRFQEAIEAATVAERYRQKFPRGDVYYVRLARTYEVLAKAYEGRFSGSEDPDDLDLAIRMWQRYLTHVEKKEDTKRIRMAEDNIAKLERIKERVQ